MIIQIIINMKSFDKSNVEDIYYMFGGCNSLESLDLSNFVTEKATKMCHIFEQCGKLKIIDLSNYSTSQGL